MEENLIVATEMLIVGMSGVFFVLIFLAFVIWIMKAFDAKSQKAKQVEQPVLQVQKEFFESRTDKELVAIITAAAMAATGGKRLKVKKISFLSQGHDAGWVGSGRQGVMASHQIHKGAL